MQYHARLIDNTSGVMVPAEFDGPVDEVSAAEKALWAFGAEYEVVTIYPVEQLARARFDAKIAQAVLRERQANEAHPI